MTSCLIYFCAPDPRRDLIRALADLTGLPVDSEQFVYTLGHDELYVSINLNEEAVEPGQPITPGAYRELPYYVDLSADDWEDEQLLPYARSILSYFWERGLVAVAECSFEEDLPDNGGQSKNDFAWPPVGIPYS
ncbi:MAG: hypothetical protein OHK0039_36620 [Bacteroidia bacterium]